MSAQTWPPIAPDEDARMLRDQERERTYWRERARREEEAERAELQRILRILLGEGARA
jgi:hypothetical protein